MFQTTQQIAALAIRAVALNPSLGSAADAAIKMERALASGGPRATQFGLSLTTLDIKTRASAIALADGRSEVTQFDKAAAGAQLTVEKLGPALGTQVSEGAKNAATHLRSLNAEMQNTLEEAGKPLVAPLLDAFTRLTPVAEDLGRSLGSLAAVTIPVATGFAVDLAPALDGAAQAAGLLAIPLQAGADILELIPAPAREVAAALLLLNVAMNSQVAAKFVGGLGARGPPQTADTAITTGWSEAVAAAQAGAIGNRRKRPGWLSVPRLRSRMRPSLRRRPPRGRRASSRPVRYRARRYGAEARPLAGRSWPALTGA